MSKEIYLVLETGADYIIAGKTADTAKIPCAITTNYEKAKEALQLIYDDCIMTETKEGAAVIDLKESFCHLDEDYAEVARKTPDGLPLKPIKFHLISIPITKDIAKKIAKLY